MIAYLTDNTGRELKCQTTEQFCEDLFLSSSSSFAELEETDQNYILEKSLNKNLTFSVSVHENIIRLNSWTAKCNGS